MAKFICSICGFTHEGSEAPERCPVCKSPSSLFSLSEDSDQEAQNEEKDVIADSDNGECNYDASDKGEDKNLDVENRESETISNNKNEQKLKSNESDNNRSLSTAQIVILGFWGLFLFSMIFDALSKGMPLVAFISACFFAIIVCLFIGKINRKYIWAIIAAAIIIPCIAIGLTIDENEKQESETDVIKQKESVKTEQTKATNREIKSEEIEKKEENKLSSKEQKVADAGYKKGAMAGYAAKENEEFSNMFDMADQVESVEKTIKETIEQMASQQYDMEFDEPSNSEEKELKKLYIEYFKKGMDETMDALDSMEKKGGKR